MNKRATYVPSGRTELGDFWPYLLVLAGVAALTAVFYAVLIEHNAYAVGWVWLAPLGLKTWLIRMAIRDSHCRNPLLAASLLGGIGLLLFLGSYHVDQCRRWGVGWDRLDRLPGYVTFRMETDGWWAIDGRMPLVWPLSAPDHPRVVPHLPPRVSFTAHWLVFGAELLIHTLVPAFFAWRFASRPYSERLRAWFRQEHLAATPPSAWALREALRSDAVPQWAAGGLEKTDEKGEHVRIEVWFCPRSPDAPDVEPEVYLTIGDDAPRLLEPPEVAALTEVFPGLHDWAEVPVELRPAAETPNRDTNELAVFAHVPGEHVGRCKDPWVKWIGSVRLIVMIWGPIASMMLLSIAILVLGERIRPVVLPLGILFIVGMLVLAVWSIAGPRIWGEEPPLVMHIRYYRRTLLRQLLQRGDPLFDVKHPSAIYTEIVPRRMWATLNDDDRTSEAGMMLLDVDHRRILYEGDRFRWTIPFAAIRSVDCEVAVVEPEFQVVLVTFETANGLKELPLVPLADIAGNNRIERVHTLYYALHEHLKQATD